MKKTNITKQIESIRFDAIKNGEDSLNGLKNSKDSEFFLQLDQVMRLENGFLKEENAKLKKENTLLRGKLIQKIDDVKLFNEKILYFNKSSSMIVNDGEKIKLIDALDKCENSGRVKKCFNDFKKRMKKQNEQRVNRGIKRNFSKKN